MRKLVLIFSIFAYSFIATAQKKKHKLPPTSPPTAKEYDILEKRMECVFTNIYTANERLKFYPFKEYKKIVLISFEWSEPKDFIINTGADSTKNQGTEIDSLPDLDNILQKQKFYKSITKEEKVLNAIDVNKLTNILYNLSVKSTKSLNGIILSEQRYACYNPRNAILFFDENNVLREYIELCFECHRREISSEKIKLKDFCNTK